MDKHAQERLVLEGNRTFQNLRLQRDCMKETLDEIADLLGVDKNKQSGDELIMAVKELVKKAQ